MAFPHQKPRSRTGIRLQIWRWRALIESTFGLGMMDPWEVVIIYLTVLLSLVLLAYTIFFYLPLHINFLRRRAAFYALGDESGVLLGSGGIELVRGWVRSLGAERAAEGIKEGAAEVAGELSGAKEAVAQVAATTADALRSAAEL